MHAAKHCGDVNLEDLVSTEGQHSNAEDITHQLLTVVKEQGPALSAATVGCQKAAVASFQTWALRGGRGSMLGVLIGQEQEVKRGASVTKRRLVHTIVAANSVQDIIAGGKMDFVCKERNLIPFGVIRCGKIGQDRDVARHDFGIIRDKYQHACICIFVLGPDRS